MNLSHTLRSIFKLEEHIVPVTPSKHPHGYPKKHVARWQLYLQLPVQNMGYLLVKIFD